MLGIYSWNQVDMTKNIQPELQQNNHFKIMALILQLTFLSGKSSYASFKININKKLQGK